jgi:phospholipid/cholesterol/gamma-HCH transport system substrate-binding protein
LLVSQALVDWRARGDGRSRLLLPLSVKLVDGAGRLKAARIFEQSSPIDALTVTQAATAFGRTFETLSKDVVTWTVSAQ